MKISIIGCGYVGIVTGMCFAELGHTIIFIDIDKNKTESINNGYSPIYEPDIDLLIKKYQKKITATSDFKKGIMKSNISFICVGTPSNLDGSINLDYIKSASKMLGMTIKDKEKFHTIVVKSTVLPGTTEDLIIPTIQRISNKKIGIDFDVGVNPEFLKEGNAINDFFNPDRIIIGINNENIAKNINTLYKSFDCPYLITSIKTAEMIKYTNNAFLATKISFANEIGNICKQLDIDVYDVFLGVGMDHRINPAFFNSGLGFGGSCFPKDVMALINKSKELGIQPKILNSVIQVNDEQPDIVIKLLKKHFTCLNNKTIGILGLSFKPNTNDVRESRAIPIVKELIKLGTHVIVYDPIAMDNFKIIFPDLLYASSPEEVIEKAYAIIIVTEWEEFGNLDYKNKIIIDGRRITKLKEKEKNYEGVCW